MSHICILHQADTSKCMIPFSLWCGRKKNTKNEINMTLGKKEKKSRASDLLCVCNWVPKFLKIFSFFFSSGQETAGAAERWNEDTCKGGRTKGQIFAPHNSTPWYIYCKRTVTEIIFNKQRRATELRERTVSAWFSAFQLHRRFYGGDASGLTYSKAIKMKCFENEVAV